MVILTVVCVCVCCRGSCFRNILIEPNKSAYQVIFIGQSKMASAKHGFMFLLYWYNNGQAKSTILFDDNYSTVLDISELLCKNSLVVWVYF